MKLKIIFSASLLAFATILQAQSLEWARSFGPGSGAKMTIDDSGNVYTAGTFTGTVDFDPGVGTALLTASAPFYDVFIQKLDPSGNFIWAKSFGDSSAVNVNSIAVNASGDVHITGQFYETIDFDPGSGTTNLTSSVGVSDVYIQKLDASGNFLWAKSFGGNHSDLGRSITVDASGNVYTIGNFRGTVDFDPGSGITSISGAGSGWNPNPDVFIQKLDASGNFLWAKTFGSSSSEAARGISVDMSGNVYTTGLFLGTSDFDPGSGTAFLTSVAGWDIFVQKLDSSGNFLWAKSFAGSGLFDESSCITVDDSGNVYTMGVFKDTIDFDPGAGTTMFTSVGGNDFYVQKLDASGNYLWAKTFGGLSGDWGYSLTIDASGNVYATGNFSGTVDFDPGVGTTNYTSVGEGDIFIQKLDASGNFLWATSFGDSLNDVGRAIATDASGNVHVYGSFDGTIDFDPGPGIANHTSSGDNHHFILKFGFCVNSTSLDMQATCDNYTWPANSTTYTTSGTYTTTLTNAAGCDSVVTLNLTINSVSDVTTTQVGDSIEANNTNAAYQWLDCDSNYTILIGETSQTFTATVNGNYAVELIENGCVDTSECVSVTTVGILENSFDQTIKLFPNPTRGTFMIDLGNTLESVKIEIRDARGSLVHTSNYHSTSNMEVTLDQAADIYLLEITSGEKVAKLKLIKE